MLEGVSVSGYDVNPRLTNLIGSEQSSSNFSSVSFLWHIPCYEVTCSIAVQFQIIEQLIERDREIQQLVETGERMLAPDPPSIVLMRTSLKINGDSVLSLTLLSFGDAFPSDSIGQGRRSAGEADS